MQHLIQTISDGGKQGTGAVRSQEAVLSVACQEQEREHQRQRTDEGKQYAMRLIVTGTTAE